MLTPPSRIAHLATAGATARVTQIVNLTLLAPDIQEAILSLPEIFRGPDPITERDLRPIVAEPGWGRQRVMWSELNG